MGNIYIVCPALTLYNPSDTREVYTMDEQIKTPEEAIDSPDFIRMVAVVLPDIPASGLPGAPTKSMR